MVVSLLASLNQKKNVRKLYSTGPVSNLSSKEHFAFCIYPLLIMNLFAAAESFIVTLSAKKG